jgi:hypothetical protein
VVALEWLLSAVIIGVASPAFGHFETVRPLWTRIVRWLAYRNGIHPLTSEPRDRYERLRRRRPTPRSAR